MASFKISILFYMESTYKYCELQSTIRPSRDTGPEMWLQLDYLVTKVKHKFCDNVDK